MTDITEEIHFLNSTVVNFNASLGFNSNPSTFSATLAEDPDLSEEFGSLGSPASDPNKYAVGGTLWADGNPGTYAEFEVPGAAGGDPPFTFSGFVTDWRRKNDVGGNLVTVNMSDARIVFSGISIVTDIATRGASQGRNVIDVLGYWGDIVSAGWTRKGVPWKAVYEILNDADHVHYVYGEAFSFLVDDSWFGYIDDDYRLPVQNTTLDQFFNKVAADHNIDYYAESQKVGGRIIVSLIPVPRNNIDALGDTSLHQLISTWADIGGGGASSRLKSVDYGRELRTDPSHAILWGDNKKSFSINNQSDHGIYPIYERFKDGTYSDRVIVDLSNISDVSGLPTVNVENMNLTGYSTYTKSRGNSSIPAYPANVNILRAALHSKDAWATEVWYTFNDGPGATVSGNNAFDELHTTQLGGVGGATGGSAVSGTPQKLGILKPPFDRAKGAAGFNAFSSAGNTPTSITEAKKEAVYRTTKKVAEEYYGRTFITPLPASAMMNTLISGGLPGMDHGGPGANSYVSKDKRFLVEYEVASEAWPVGDIDDTNTHVWFPSEMVGQTESDEFQTQEGLIKGIVRFNKELIKGEYTQADFANMPSDRYLKSGEYLYTSAASFSQYQFDPRFVIIKVNDHINLGFDKIRGIKLQSDEEGSVTGFTQHPGELPRPPKDKDMSGGTQNFLSNLYNDFTIVLKLSDGAGNPIPVIESSKQIDAEHYYNLIYHSSISNKDKLGYSEMRFLGYDHNGNTMGDSINTATPIKWNFVRYGPFEGGPLTPYVTYWVPTKTMVDNSLNPWSYGSMGRMESAGDIQAQNMQSASTTLAYANASVEGFPEMGLGQSVGNITRLSNVSMNYSTAGVMTQYRFKTFFGPIGFNKKSEIDKIHRITSDNGSGEDKVSVEDIRREMLKAAKDKLTGMTINGLYGGSGGAGAGTGSPNVIKSNTPGLNGTQNPATDLVPDDELNQAMSNEALDLWRESYYSKLEELFTPYRTGGKQTDQRVPNIEGIDEE
tara:strand:+ start:1774 stop:4776 length:3003 start_codon:yes stop_codon:yes gene_type:complete